MQQTPLKKQILWILFSTILDNPRDLSIVEEEIGLLQTEKTPSWILVPELSQISDSRLNVHRNQPINENQCTCVTTYFNSYHQVTLNKIKDAKKTSQNNEFQI